MSNDPPEPGAGLLRVAGLPAAVLDRAGAPELFGRVRVHERSTVEEQARAVALVARLSADLAPYQDIAPGVRGRAMTLRRRLARGLPADPADCRRLAADCAALAGFAPAAAGLRALADRAAAAVAAETALTADLAAERDRVAALPWEILATVPAAYRIVACTAPDVLAELRARLAAGESPAGKRLRQRGEYVWRLLTRAAVKTTPRGWLGHVALVGSAPGRPDDLVAGLRVTDTAVHRVVNIGAHRQALARAEEPPADGTLSLPGTHWVRDGRLCCWAADPDTPGGSRFVRVRLTEGVAAVRETLAGGAMRTGDLVALLAPGDAGRRRVARRFLRHLVGLGVLQLSAPPAAHLTGWTARPRPVAPVADEYVDVYRRADGHVPAAAITRLGELAAQATRVYELTTGAVAATGHPVLGLVDERPRPVTDLLARFLDDADPRPLTRRRSGWPSPRPGTPYARLCDWLLDRAGDPEVDLTSAVLDDLGVPPARPPVWPVDCLVRPLPTGKPLAVLEAMLPAGVADARFADALTRLHGEPSPVAGHRAFLAAAAAAAGAEPVEILVPPHGDRGANTVRRPRYTADWTGDADAGTYLPGPTAGRYLPLDRITLRRDEDRVVAEDPLGRVLWPVCHATQVPPVPWDLVIALLTAAAPVGRLAAPVLFGDHTALFPGRGAVPRLVLDGGLVLAGRAVVLDRHRLPAPGMPYPRRVRALAAVRPATGAPRWNLVRAAGAGRPRPVDLDSVTALRVLDRLLADPAVPALVFEEMLPGPDDLSVLDETGAALAAQLLVRLPHAADPARLAEEAALAGRVRRLATTAG